VGRVVLQLSVPSVVGRNLLSELKAEEMTPGEVTDETEWLLVGPPRSGTRWHFDPHGVSGYNILFEGRKLWLFWSTSREQSIGWGQGWGEASMPFLPPELNKSATEWVLSVLPAWFTASNTRNSSAAVDTDYAGPMPARARFAHLRFAVQTAGDMVYVPHGLWHCVVNLSDTVAFQGQLVNLYNAAVALQTCAEYAPLFTERLQAHMQHDRLSEGSSNHSRQ